jgi:hypothetical protein
MGFSQRQTTQGPKACHLRRRSLLDRLPEQHYGVGDASGQAIRRTQGCRHPWTKERKFRFLTDAHGAFEGGDGLVQVTLAEAHQSDPI